MKQIGNLFILRININLVGSILDSPEFFWYAIFPTCAAFSPVGLTSSDRSFPDLEPLYTACRSYLEISQRIDLLNARVDVSSPPIPCPDPILTFNQVLQDMLKLLKESVNSTHGERLEVYVIILM